MSFLYQDDRMLSCGWVIICPMKKLTREKYQELRKIVRRNIWANSQEVALKKYQYLYGFTVMGGVVLKKKITRGKCYPLGFQRSGPIEKYGPPSYDLHCRHSEDRRASLNFHLEVFDFSGVFEIEAVSNNITPNVEDLFRKIRKGDIVFATGQVQFDRSSGKLVFSVSWIGSEHEFVNRLSTRPEEFEAPRRIADVIKNGGYYLKWELLAGAVHPEKPEIREWTFHDLVTVDSHEAIRSFYRLGRKDKDIPDFLQALYGIFWINRFSWIPRLIVKYFKLQILKGVKDRNASRSRWRNYRDQFIESFPLLRRKIYWPSQIIEDLRLKTCDRN